MNQYKVYFKENCPYCDRVKKLLNICKLNHTLHDVSDPEVRKEFDSYFPGVTGVPPVLYNESPIGDSMKFVAHLKELKLI